MTDWSSVGKTSLLRREMAPPTAEKSRKIDRLCYGRGLALATWLFI